MSYENTVCPCDGKKEMNTMLCDECEAEFADHPCMVTFKDRSRDFEVRRHAAITLCTMARGRKARLKQ